MTKELLTIFREEVTDDDLTYHIYKNKDGKNKWSVICSAMDWIEVVVEGIDLSRVQHGNDNESSMKLMMFISCIDVLWEAVQQLHRVLFDTANIPFANEKNVFSDKLIDTTDNLYFKTIRACFAAHPVNLNDRFREGEKNEQRFASWSTGGIATKKDFTVFLYSNQPGEKVLMLDISFQELFNFAQRRYEHLTELTEQLRKIKRDYLDTMKGVIERPSDTISHIRVLKEANKTRFGNDYYDYELTKIEKVFSIEPSSPRNADLLHNYQATRIPVIEEIHTNLENMTLLDIELTKDTHLDVPSDCQYFFADLASTVYGDGTAYIWGIEPFTRKLDGIVDFQSIHSCEELYVLLLAGFYQLKHGKQ